MGIYFFGNGRAEGMAEMKKLLGGKAAKLAEMTTIGMPVTSGRDTFHVSGSYQVKNIFYSSLLDGYAVFAGQSMNCTCPPYRY